MGRSAVKQSKTNSVQFLEQAANREREKNFDMSPVALYLRYGFILLHSCDLNALSRPMTLAHTVCTIWASRHCV